MRRTSFSGDFRVGETFAENMRENVIKSLAVVNRGFFASAIVETESLFIQIPEQVERFDANIGSLETALQQAPVVFEAVGVHVPTHVFVGVVNHFVSELTIEVIIGRQLIGEKNRISGYVLTNFLVHGVFASVLGHGGANFTAPFHESDNKGFVASTSSLNLALAGFLVHVPREAADKSFVHFDNFPVTTKFHEGTALHGKANPVEHEPCGFLSDADSASDFIGTDTVLAVRQHPHGSKPLVQRDRRIFKDSPDLGRELPFGVDALALPLSLIGEETGILTSAGRAYDAIRPSEADHIGQRVSGIREVGDCLLECLWLSHFHSPETHTSLRALICQVYYCPN